MIHEDTCKNNLPHCIEYYYEEDNKFLGCNKCENNYLLYDNECLEITEIDGCDTGAYQVVPGEDSVDIQCYRCLTTHNLYEGKCYILPAECHVVT